MESLRVKGLVLGAGLCIGFYSGSAAADTVLFDTGDPDGLMATASRPSTSGKAEIESADDFSLSSDTRISGATFTGLLTGGASLPSVGEIRVEIYRVFPNDSSPPSGKVPTRANSPSDVEFDDRDTASGALSFTAAILNSSFTANNSVVNGINPIPTQTTGGEGSVTGIEVKFSVNFTSAFVLPADHYFFVPQVAVTGGEFLWLSAPKPIASGTGPFLPDLQEWIRNDSLAPNWLRVGTDIVGGTPAPTFNAAFSLIGATAVPEPPSLPLLAAGLAALALARRRTKLCS